jgi:hypothetical protein
MSECESISVSIPIFLKDKMEKELKEKKQYNNNKSAIIQDALIKRYTLGGKIMEEKMFCILLLFIGGGLNIFSIIALSVSYAVTGVLFGIGSLTMIFGALKARKIKWT